MAEMMRKVLYPEIKDLGDRVLEFVGSTEAQDRDGDIIRASGWNLKDFKNNPVIMWAHDYSQPPIGRAKKVWVDNKQLRFEVEFASKETYEFADVIYRLVKDGYIKATSVGFIPRQWDELTSKEGDPDFGWNPLVYKRQDLLELSIVPVPSNPEALRNAWSSGVITAKEFKAITKSEGAEDIIQPTVPDKCTSQAEIRDELDYVKSLIIEGNLNEENGDITWDIVRERITGGDIPEDILLKVGAVLSSKNKSDLGKARELIQNVLDSSEPQQPTQEPEKEAEEVETKAPVVLGATELAGMVRQAYQGARDYQLGKV